ncbi:MAG: T9SS type A sorting domain-containing protein [Calditrichia bacterium]
MKVPALVRLIATLSFFISLELFSQYPNIRVSNPASTSPNEVTIAINPQNPLNLAAGANLRFYYYSMDGGYTWAEGQLSSSLGVWGDPGVVFDSDGNLYYRLVVQKSTNGGVSWDDGAGVGLDPPRQQDKEWMAVDITGSPYHNNIYMAWTEFDDYGSFNPNDSTRILFSRSVDGGLNWSQPVRVSDVGGNCVDSDSTVEGAVPAIGPNGEIYLSWAGPLGIMFDKSLDGGATWGSDVFVADQPGGWDFAVPGIYRCNGLPVTTCDNSTNSPYSGNIYVLWADQRNGFDNTDVFIIKSSDGGNTWSNIVRVNDDNSARHQFFPWMTIDPATGYIYVVFYDRRNTSGIATDVYVARSTDGGETFTNFKVSETSFTPNSTVFFGDYINIAALNSKVYPIWMRMDQSDRSVWIAIIEDSTVVGIQGEEPLASPFYLARNYPNPFNPATNLQFRISDFGLVRLAVYDLLGREVRILVNDHRTPGSYTVQWDGKDNTGKPVSSGIYIYRLQVGDFSQSRKLVLMR